jgi:UDP-N-acetylmuramyl tripeptide synthase
VHVSSTPLPVRARLAVAVGRGLGALSRAAGRGSGSVIGGHAILGIQPSALSVLAAGRQVLLVSGTNGKTTTTKLLASALTTLPDPAGLREVVTNLLGANMPAGLAAALAGAPPGAPAVLEVDEAWLGRVAAQVKPAVMVLLNLSRDQLDRNNEVRHVAQRWRQACQDAPDAVVVANADDPLVAWAAMRARRVTWVGAGLRWRNDATGCPECGGPILFADAGSEAHTHAAAALDGDGALERDGRPGVAGGGWRCQACGLSRPQPDIWLDTSGAGGRAAFAVGESYPIELQLPGRCNQANAVMAVAGVLGAGGSAAVAMEAMTAVSEVAGRYATLPLGALEARLLLAKNPAGWAEVFDMLAPPPAPVVIAINARTADGHDPSWLWDVPFEVLQGRPAIATGERGLDLAVRLHYAQVDHELVPDLLDAVQSAGRHRPAARAPAASGPPPVDVVANYTSFHQLLARSGRAGGAG